jgi:hypothetical protein
MRQFSCEISAVLCNRRSRERLFQSLKLQSAGGVDAQHEKRKKPIPIFAKAIPVLIGAILMAAPAAAWAASIAASGHSVVSEASACQSAKGEASRFIVNRGAEVDYFESCQCSANRSEVTNEISSWICTVNAHYERPRPRQQTYVPPVQQYARPNYVPPANVPRGPLVLPGAR